MLFLIFEVIHFSSRLRVWGPAAGTTLCEAFLAFKPFKLAKVSQIFTMAICPPIDYKMWEAPNRSSRHSIVPISNRHPFLHTHEWHRLHGIWGLHELHRCSRKVRFCGNSVARKMCHRRVEAKQRRPDSLWQNWSEEGHSARPVRPLAIQC